MTLPAAIPSPIEKPLPADLAQTSAGPVPTLKLGSVELEAPVVQAALSGYSDWPMRIMARRHGAAYTLAEVMLDRFVLEYRPERLRTHHRLFVTDEERPVGGQLMGADPEQFGPAARKLVEAGFDVIDINFGCPVKKVLGRCRGGFHLSQPAVALDIVGRVRDAVSQQIPVTLKMRRGIDDSACSEDQFYEILDGAFARGVAAVTVHGRTVMQGYKGPSNWNFLAQVKEHLGARRMMGSGDLFSAQDCVQMLRTTGVDGVSIARGAIGNPWIFAQVRSLLTGEASPPPPSVWEQGDVLREHFALSQQAYGPERCLTMMRKFGVKYARLHPEHPQVRNEFAVARTTAGWYRVLTDHYQVDGPGCFPQVDDTAHNDGNSASCAAEL